MIDTVQISRNALLRRPTARAVDPPRPGATSSPFHPLQSPRPARLVPGFLFDELLRDKRDQPSKRCAFPSCRKKLARAPLLHSRLFLPSPVSSTLCSTPPPPLS